MMSSNFANVMTANLKSIPMSSMPASGDEEDRILRVWTPMLLRSVLAISVTLTSAGIVEAVLHWPLGHAGAPIADLGRTGVDHLPWRAFLEAAVRGDATATATLGLMALTLVPLVRVAFCLLLFLKQRNRIFAAFTAYVLAGLTIGIMLGRIG